MIKIWNPQCLKAWYFNYFPILLKIKLINVYFILYAFPDKRLEYKFKNTV